MEPFRIIPTRRWLRSSKKAQEVNEKGDQLGILGAKPKAASPHPDPSTLAKEMEEFEKLMQLGSTEGDDGSDAKDTHKNEKAEKPIKEAGDKYVPDQPTTSLEPYEPTQPTASPVIPTNVRQTSKSPEAYEPDEPTPVDEVYTPDQPTSLQSSDPYEPEQPTDEPMVVEDSDISASAKREESEVEADMPQLQLDSVSSGYHGQVEKGGEHAARENTDSTPAESVPKHEGNKSEQENLLPEEWLRKKEKKKKHGKHKKPLVEWRLGVLRKDYVIKDFKSFPVDEKLMATTKHKWNNESEVEHLKVLHSGDGSQTDTSEVSGMTSPAIAQSDSELESEQNTSGEIDAIGRADEENTLEGDDSIHSSKDNAIVHAESKCADEEIKKGEYGETGNVKESAVPEKVQSISVLDAQLEKDTRLDSVEKSEDLDAKKNQEKQEVQTTGKEEKKIKSEPEESSNRRSTRQSSRRARRDSGENKTDTDQRSDKKDDDSGRRRSRRTERHKDDSDDEKRKESDRNKAESDRTRNETRRRSLRRDRFRDNSDDERREESREGRRRGRSDSRERRERSNSRERRRYRDDDDRYDRYDRGRRTRRSDRRSMDRTDDRRSREDDRRNERSLSREQDERRRKEKNDKDLKKEVDKTKEESKVTAEKRTEKADLRDDDKLQGKGKTDAKITESNTVPEKDQNNKQNTSNKATGRVPIKFNFTSRAVRRSTRSAVKAKSGVFEDDEDEDEKPLSELQNLCDEKEAKSSKSEPSEDKAPAVTRSKSREGYPVEEPTEVNKVSQITSVPFETGTSTRSKSSQKVENLFEITLRKESKKDHGSESDSGAELSLMGLGEAPSLYPESILESQVEMELLANAFSSTDTEAEIEIEKVFCKKIENDTNAKEEESSPKQEDRVVDSRSEIVDMEVEEEQHDASTIEVLSHPQLSGVEGTANDSISTDSYNNTENRTFTEEVPIIQGDQTNTDDKELINSHSPQQNGKTCSEELPFASEGQTSSANNTNLIEHPQKVSRTCLYNSPLASEKEKSSVNNAKFIDIFDSQSPCENIRTCSDEVPTTLDEQESTVKDTELIDSQSPLDISEVTGPFEEQTSTDDTRKLIDDHTLQDNERASKDKASGSIKEKSSSEIDVNGRQGQNEIFQNRDIDVDKMLNVPEIKIVPPPDETLDQACSEAAGESTEEKEIETANTSLETDQSDTEIVSPLKARGSKEHEDDFTKTESESDDAMTLEVIDLMAGTAYTTSKVSVVLPPGNSDADAKIEDISEAIVDNEAMSHEQNVTILDKVMAASCPIRPPSSDTKFSDGNTECIVLDHSTSEQIVTVQKSSAEVSSEVMHSSENVMPFTEVVSTYLPSEKPTIEVFNKESAMNEDEILEANVPSSNIDSAKNVETSIGIVPSLSEEGTEISSTQEAVTAITDPPTRHIIQEGPSVSKRKRKSRWEVVSTEIPSETPPQMAVNVDQSQQNKPSLINMTGEPVLQTEAKAEESKLAPVEALIGEEISSSPSTIQIQPSDVRLTVDSSEVEGEISPTKKVKVDPDATIGATADYSSSQDGSTSNLILDAGESKMDATYHSCGLDLEVNAAGDNQAVSKPEDFVEKEEAGIIMEESKDTGEVTKPGPGTEEESMEEGELDSDVKEEMTEKPWDDSTGIEQGEIKDDGDEEVEDSREERTRRSSQDKENTPFEDYWAGDGRREVRERPKEERRESREERQRRQYQEWGMVERSKMPRFSELTENYYLTERRRSKAGKEARRMVCCCTTSREERRRGIQACGEDCLNRVLMLECGSRCPCGDYCTNKRFQKREHARVGVFYAEGKGHGLKTKEELKENEFVMEYVGEVLNFHEFKHRAKQYSKDKNLHFYFMALKSDEIIDATEKGNVSRFMNHSCDPNCETQKWTVNGQLRVGFFTKRQVKPGEELTFDYQFEVYGQEAQKCLCGSDKCRGVIGKQKKQKEGKDTTPRRRGSVGEKRRKEAFTDITLEDEIQQMVDELDECGLQSNDHTIALSRFMVRADQPKQRLALLKLLQETTEQTYLKYFLFHHGLRLIWSWMVDLGDNPAELQMQILTTLAKLPIPNKNALEDSKVLSVIERWARDFAKQGPTQEMSSVTKADSDVDSSSASETPSRSDTPISAAMASSMSTNMEMLKSIAEATSSESDMDSEAPSGLPLALRQRLEVESTESPTSTGSEGESMEKPTSSAEDSQNEQQGDEAQGQPDSASDAATSSSAVAESFSKDKMALESAVVDSTEAGLQDVNDNTEVRTLKSLAADAARQVQSQNSSSDAETGAAMSQSEDIIIISESSAASTSESGNGTSNVEQPSSMVLAETDNEAESKTDEDEEEGKSELANIISSLLSSWSDLKEIYRIPKKESEKDRDRHREHDRDRDRRYDRDRDYDRDRHRDRDHGRDRDRNRDRDDRHHRDRSRDGDRDRHRDKDRKDRDKSDDKSRRKRSRSNSKERETKSSWSKDSDANATPPKLRKPWKDAKGKEPKEGKGVVKEDVKIDKDKDTKKMSKEERRHLFEMQVEAKEREDAARKEQEALMMAQWQESEQQRQQQMAQFIDVNGFPMDPNAPGMMVNEHGMPIEVIPGHMDGMPMGEPYMGHPDMPHPDMPYHPDHVHPDMQGQFPEMMQQHEHMGMEEGYHHPMHEHHMAPPHEGQPMYDDSGFPIPPQEHGPPGMMGMPQQHEGLLPHPGMEQMHPGMEYQMHPDMDPNVMGHHHHEHPSMDPHMMGQHFQPNMDVHLLGGQPHPGDPSMYTPQPQMMQPQVDAVPPQEVHVPQVVPIPAAGPAQVPNQPGPREEELMPPPSLPVPTRKSKKSKSQKSAAKSSKKSPPSTTYVAPAAPVSSASPVLPLPSSSVASVNPQSYAPAQAAPGVLPVAQAPQVLQTPVLPQAPQQAAQTTFTFVTPDGMLVTQTIVPLAATEQGISHVQHQQQMAGVQQQQPQVTESIPSPPAKPKTAKLPPKWKTAQDAEGKTYYYHSVTRQTQWDMPTWEDNEGEMYDEEAGGGSNTPTYDEKSRQKTTTAPADTSSEAAKRLKEAFRSKMSHHVVGYLNAYRKPDCKMGRITNTEDFKHLARKLTHGIMAKELKHCRNIEDLEVNENVKHKAKEYIKKYMGRYGKLYKKDPADFDL
nr:histone-lysine N-methyltransferase SETD2-like [Lytechinus pictus]